jgi:hypothetical protein
MDGECATRRWVVRSALRPLNRAVMSARVLPIAHNVGRAWASVDDNQVRPISPMQSLDGHSRDGRLRKRVMQRLSFLCGR